MIKLVNYYFEYNDRLEIFKRGTQQKISTVKIPTSRKSKVSNDVKLLKELNPSGYHHMVEKKFHLSMNQFLYGCLATYV